MSASGIGDCLDKRRLSSSGSVSPFLGLYPAHDLGRSFSEQPHGIKLVQREQDVRLQGLVDCGVA